jgi:hypothetical protein
MQTAQRLSNARQAGATVERLSTNTCHANALLCSVCIALSSALFRPALFGCIRYTPSHQHDCFTHITRSITITDHSTGASCKGGSTSCRGGSTSCTGASCTGGRTGANCTGGRTSDSCTGGTALRFASLTALHCAALSCVALHCIALRRTLLQCIARLYTLYTFSSTRLFYSHYSLNYYYRPQHGRKLQRRQHKLQRR